MDELKLSKTTGDGTKQFTTSEVDGAKKFGEFFIDLLENHRDNLVFYLADTAILDWFGHTIKGPRDIATYLKNNSGVHKLHFTTFRPVSQIGFRESHVVKVTCKTPLEIERSALGNQSTEGTPTTFRASTPIQLTEIGQGDGPQNYQVPESPMKRCKLDHGDGDSVVTLEIKYLCAEGHVEFRKKSSKKLQDQTKWNRPCKFEVAYCGNNFNDCTIYMMIYQGNMKCRRNLLKDFDSCEPVD